MVVRRPSLSATLARILIVSTLITALVFAITLLVSILSLAILSAVRHTTLDMAMAYRVIGVRVVIVGAPLILLIVAVHQLREYRRVRTEARPLIVDSAK